MDATTLTLGFSNAGARESFLKGGSAEIVRQAAIDVVGADWTVEAIVDPGAQPEAPREDPEPARAAQAGPEPAAVPSAAPPAPADPEPPADPPAWAADADPGAIAAAREAIQQTRPAGTEPAPSDALTLADADADPEDPDAETEGLAGAELLQRTLGAEVIEEIPHQ